MPTTDTLPDRRFTRLPNPLVTPEPRGRVLCPRAVALPGGGYRLYFMEHGDACPPGNHGVVVSARSDDGDRWEREAGVRLGPTGPRSAARVLAPDLVPLPNGGWRMYAEARSDAAPSVVISARSSDGLAWTPEPGLRIADPEDRIAYGSPNCVALPGGGWRLYCHARTDAYSHIVSARSDDGLTWTLEPGVRIAQDRPEEGAGAYSAFVGGGPETWWMVYAGWSGGPDSAGRLLAADSANGLDWRKRAAPVLEPATGLDARHCSEPTLLRLADGSWRLYYEACDAHGVWRILGAAG